MSASSSYRLSAKPVSQQRPFGVAVLAALGVFGSVLIIVGLLLGLWYLLRESAEPSVQLAVLILQLAFAIVILRINWGFWEMLKWAWWANLLLTLLSIAAVAFVMRYTATIGDITSRLRPELTKPAVTTVVRSGLVGDLGLNLLVLLYLFNVRTVFGVGVKDERPLWKKVHRH